MTDPKRRALRSFLEAAMTAAPSRADYEALALPDDALRVARAAVAYVRRTARPEPGAWHGASARVAADRATDEILAAAEGWEGPTKEDPLALADSVRERS